MSSAFDPTQPTDVTKIRDLGVVIRPNWLAIQTADTTFQPQALNFTDRTVASIPVNPTAIADAYITYCKTDTAGNSELFGINESSQVIQFTKGIPTFALSESSIFIAGGLILKMGKKAFIGTNTSVAVTFGTAFPTNCFGVVATMVGDTNSTSIQNTITTTGFTMFRGPGGVSGASFNWIAWGN